MESWHYVFTPTALWLRELFAGICMANAFALFVANYSVRIAVWDWAKTGNVRSSCAWDLIEKNLRLQRERGG